MAFLRALRRTSLLMRFAVLSAVLVAALGVVLSTVFATFVRQATVESLVSSATTNINALADLTVAQTGARATQLSPAQAKLATEIFDAFMRRHVFVGYEAYLPDGTIIASENSSLVGKRVPLSPQLHEAFAGQAFHSVDEACADSHGRQLCNRHGQLLEVVTPLKIAGAQSTTAVLRDWLSFASTQTTISRDVHRIWVLLGAGLLILYVGLFRLMAKASRGLRRDAEFHRKRAAQDVLTGVSNRSVLPDRVADALATASQSGGQAALVLIDLDRFKQVNDRLGHHVGDLVLQHTAQQLRSAVRPGDTVARLGGDEFVVVLPEVATAQAAAEAAERLVAAVADPLEVEGSTVVTRASAGVALGADHGDTFLDLLRRADAAMYCAKAGNGGVRMYAEDTEDAEGVASVPDAQLLDAPVAASSVN